MALILVYIKIARKVYYVLNKCVQCVNVYWLPSKLVWPRRRRFPVISVGMHRSLLQKSDANSQLYVLVECLTIRQQERRNSRKILWIERKYWTAVPRLTVSRNEFRRFSANCESKGGNCCVSWCKWLNGHGTTVPPSTSSPFNLSSARISW